MLFSSLNAQPQHAKQTPDTVTNHLVIVSHDHPTVGNRRFRVLCDANLQQYEKCKTKREKSVIVMSIVDAIREGAGRKEFGFVMQDPATRRFYEAKEAVAREKVGQQLRELIAQKCPDLMKKRKADRKRRAMRAAKKRMSMSSNATSSTSSVVTKSSTASADAVVVAAAPTSAAVQEQQQIPKQQQQQQQATSMDVTADDDCCGMDDMDVVPPPPELKAMTSCSSLMSASPVTTAAQSVDFFDRDIFAASHLAEKNLWRMVDAVARGGVVEQGIIG